MPLAPASARHSALIVGAVVVAFSGWAAADWYRAAPLSALRQAAYVGRDSCLQCHLQQGKSWSGSHHDRAMETATYETVLGDFDDAEFIRFGERTFFFRDREKFMVNAEGPDGENHDYEVKWTFGVDPLQQYMVEFPDGRVQVLRVSWDVHKKKWFYVAPPDAAEERIVAGDPLHWTGLAQNWNSMCADCHSTDYHKNYDLASNTYHSEYFEIDVSCEACHGPGSVHVELAEGRSLFWDRNVGYGLTNALKNASNVRQVETCAQCHSRRASIHPNYRAGDELYDHFDPVLLYAGLYHANGQMQDEVYEYGSFTQSKMYHKGVSCNDCHDAHSLKLKYPGNRLCAQCHQPGKYDGAGHHHHPNAAADAPETQCVSCHMPTRTYMEIDERRDHSLHVPRPDLTVELGTPNACNRCHIKRGEDAAWAAAAIVEWFGPRRPDDPHFAHALDAGQQGLPDGETLIRQLLRRESVPELVRATAVSLLNSYQTESSARLRRQLLDDPSPAVRAAAVRGLTADSPARLLQETRPLLGDPIRAVRMAAAARLVTAAAELAGTEFRRALDEAISDYRAGQEMHLDRIESHLSLATLSEQLGDIAGAIESFRTAIRVEPYRAGPRRELARLLDMVGHDPAHAKLREQVKPNDEEIRRLRAQEVDLLARDAALLPGDAQPHYLRGMLLYQLNELDEAREALEEACRISPSFYQAWMALALICERQERWVEAARAVKKMSELRPEADDWKALGLEIQAKMRAKQEAEAAAAPHSESLSPEGRSGSSPPETPP